ncbi:MAG: hypothetical protein NC347_08975, partial [Clostridium sp.]|nr:hypothetical protein [Clostridium sp.]
MSIYEKLFNTFYNTCTTFLSSLGTYSQEAEKVYTKILEELINEGFPKGNIKALCDAQDVSQIFLEVDELAEAGYKIDKQSVALYKLYGMIYNKVTGLEFDVSSLSTSNINAFATFSKFLSKSEGITAVAGACGVAIESAILISEGKEDEAGVKLRQYGYGLLGGLALGIWAKMVVVPLLVSNPFSAIVVMVVCSMGGTEIGKIVGMVMDVTFGLYDDAGAYTYPVDPLI